MVDVERYKAEALMSLKERGTVLLTSASAVTVEWDDSTVEQVPVEHLCAEFVAFSVGQRFEAVCLRRPHTFELASIVHVEPTSTVPAPDRYDARFKGTTDLPEADWD